MADSSAKLVSPDLEKTEDEICRNLVVPGRMYAVKAHVSNLRHIIETSLQRVYFTRAEKDNALQQHLDDIREKAVLKILGEAKALAEKGDSDYINKAGYAIAVSGEEILGIKNAKSRNWVCESALQIEKIYKQHKGVNAGPAPGVIDLRPLNRRQDLDTICSLILDEFTGKTGYKYMESHAQLLYDYLKLAHKGGIALENAFCEMYEGLRETAVIMLVREAAKLANKRDRGFEVLLQDAENAIYSNVKIGYRVPENKYAYGWFDKECNRIKSIYENSVR